MRGGVRRTGQKSVTVDSPLGREHPGEVNQICSPSLDENLSRTSSMLMVYICSSARIYTSTIETHTG
jgi:hypothetical protein